MNLFMVPETVIAAGQEPASRHSADPQPSPPSALLPPELEAFLLDRFTTILEDPHTGRCIRPSSLGSTP